MLSSIKQIRRVTQDLSTKRQFFSVQCKRMSTSQIVRPDLRGRDFINGEFSPAELKSVLWTAADLKHRSIEDRESFDYMKGKSVTILQESGVPDSFSTVALETAAQRLGGNVTRMTVDFNEFDVSDLASCLSEMSAVIGVRCRHQAALQSVADGAAVPVISLGSEQHDPLTALAELMAVLEHYSHLKRLTMAWVGPCRARLRSLLQLLPPLGLHLRYCCPQEEDLTPEEMAELVKLTVRHHTQFSRHDTVEDATYRAHVLTTTWHTYPQLQITQQHAAEAALDWTFVQDLPVSSEAVAADVRGARKHSLVTRAAGCRHWLAAGLLTELSVLHERRTQTPDFDDER